jgi:hypothetical protein
MMATKARLLWEKRPGRRNRCLACPAVVCRQELPCALRSSMGRPGSLIAILHGSLIELGQLAGRGVERGEIILRSFQRSMTTQDARCPSRCRGNESPGRRWAWLPGERRIERVDAVADWSFALRIATVGGLDPIDGGWLVGAPAEFAGPWFHGVAIDGQIVDQRRVVEDLGSPVAMVKTSRRSGKRSYGW